MSNISAWSTTATNNNAASPNGFPEGMPPSGVNDSMREVMAAVRKWYESAEWIDLGHTPAYVSATTFTIATDVTATYHVGRRVRCADVSTLYGTITASSYAAPNTTVTVTLDSGSLSASLAGVSVGAASYNNSSVPTSLPEGSIIAWNPGYYTDGSNGGYTNALGAGNTVSQANTYLNPLGWWVCDGAALNRSTSAIFNGASRYLPNLTDDRFLMGDTAAGFVGGGNTMDHTHGVTTNNHTHTGPSHTHTGPSHTHDVTTPSTGWNLTAAGVTGALWSNLTSAGSGWYSTTGNVLTSTTGGTGSTGADGTGATSSSGGETVTSGAASNTENRPLFLSCFYIVRVN